MSADRTLVPMSSAEREVFKALFMKGPLWDGNVSSKSGRSDLVDRGYVMRWNGWQQLTPLGLEIAVGLWENLKS